MAPHVQRVVALDLTPGDAGTRPTQEAARQGLTNLLFEQGEAEHLTYPNEAFDMVVTRFSLHHFADPRAPLQEMVRVCRPGGSVAVIDMVLQTIRRWRRHTTVWNACAIRPTCGR